MIRLLNPIAYQRQPWKNGGGTTTEIVIHPEGAGWNDFQWRVGIADIRQSGPFSSFPGIDRSIMLLDGAPGAGMTLAFDGTAVELAQGEFFDFPGDAITHGTLRGSHVRDFNVMSRRSAFSHRCDRSSLAPGQVLRLGACEWCVVYVAIGDIDVVTAAHERKVIAGESLVAQDADALDLRAGAAGAQLVWASFASRAAAEAQT